MSDHIPFEIQAQIMKSLPVKSLVKFRSVSKQWKSHIESSKFIASYNPPDPQPQHLFIRYMDSEEFKQRYISFLDNNNNNNNTFPNHKFFPIIPVSVTQLNNPTVIGSSKGLFCFFSNTGKTSVPGTVVLWNPCIRKSVVIDVPYRTDEIIVGFVVCPRTNDPKLVKVSFITSPPDYHLCISQVEVFSLSSNVWRTLSINLPDKSIELTGNQEVIDGVIYWISVDRAVVPVPQILSFNITTEEFTKVCLPDILLLNSYIRLSISKLRENIVVLEHDLQGYHVWIMDNGVEKSFTKLFTINRPNESIDRVLGFRYSGEPIIGVIDRSYYEEQEEGTLFVYQPHSKDIDDIGIFANLNSCFVKSYMKTLLLLDH